MVRTKKHFRPPSPSSGSSSSSEEEEEVNTQPQTVQRGMGKQLHFSHGGGKQLSVVGGFRGGKQLRMEPQEESEDESSSSSSESEEEAPATTTVTYNRSAGGGKQLRVPGGKQLRPPPAQEEEEESDDSEEEDEEEEKQVFRQPGGGKQFGGKAFRGGKQLVRPPTPDMDDDSDSSSDEEEEAPPPTTTVVQRGHGGGKQLRMPAPAEETKKEESADDMEESEEEEEEEAPPPPPPPKKAATPPPAPKPTPAPEPEESSSEEEIVTRPKRRGRPPASASPSTRPTRSTRSTKKVVDESSSDESSEEEFELDMETFDNNKLIKDDADRKMLDKLSELEREAILAERFEKFKADADMKRAMRDVKRREKEQKKQTKPKSKAPKKRPPPKKEPPKKRGRKAKKIESESESEDDDHDEDYEEGVPDTSGDAALAASMSGKRVSTRNLDAKGNKFKRAAALAKIRENRAQKTPAKDESDSDLDYGKDSDDSDDDYEDSTMLKPWQQTRKKTQIQESTDEESIDERHEKEPSKKRSEDIEADVEDFALVTIPRRRLIRWCNEPFFEDAVKHCYIRLGIGRDSKTQKACYRLCRVVGVESRKEYTFPPEPNKKPVTTDKWLKVTFGKAENAFKMLTISDHRPTSEDVSKYVGQLKTDRLSDTMLLKKKSVKLRKRQDNLVNNYTYTKEDIEKLVTEKKKRSKKAANIGLEKTHIAIAVQAARDAVKEAEQRIEDAKIEQMEADDSLAGVAADNVVKAKEAYEKATALLEMKIEEQNRILKDEEDRINRLKGSSKVQNWVKVNQRARLANQNADFLSYKQQLAKEKAEASAEPKFDPFARRKVKPKNLWEVGGKNATDKTSDAAVEEEKKDSHPSEDAAAAAKEADKDTRQENAEVSKLDNTGQSAPFVFDDDINIGDITSLGLKKATNRTRKGISLDDYKNRKEAGTL